MLPRQFQRARGMRLGNGVSLPKGPLLWAVLAVGLGVVGLLLVALLRMGSVPEQTTVTLELPVEQ
jgi:hypothetical protein